MLHLAVFSVSFSPPSPRTNKNKLDQPGSAVQTRLGILPAKELLDQSAYSQGSSCHKNVAKIVPPSNVGIILVARTITDLHKQTTRKECSRRQGSVVLSDVIKSINGY
ncbi:hypothetical protein RRG08_019711 [Elysia crispata]|uniref:Uncharacterized protein n=1 Tax=Elysia crispata TaxID=231223 RepID=A0AAE1B3S5_9GAST|nr:hypothetical protein RRG08_019711 [Elysia crispata]